MCQGLLEESDGEGDPDGGPEAAGERAGDASDGDAQASAAPAPLTAVEKKTEQQRRREKAARVLVSSAGLGRRPRSQARLLPPAARARCCPQLPSRPSRLAGGCQRP